ncbi:MAG: hydrogenase nickel incorporation protein HypB [Balneolaceae bacterium]
MCGICGCSDHDGGIVIRRPGEKEMETAHFHNHDHSGTHHHHPDGHSHPHSHEHNHNHDHNHSHDHDHSHPREIQLEQDILSRNNLLAERNRGFFEAMNVSAFNFLSSPGAGKTTLLEKTINALKNDIDFFVIEGDQQSMNDAERIETTGVPVIQINTGSGCHLEANMVNQAVKKLELRPNSMLFIENVGNLVCPALFDLGEAHRVVIFSVTEGDDKPVKYPTIFQKADICIINKTDLLPYVQFDVEKAKDFARRINPRLQFFETSATTGDGMDRWQEWLQDQLTPEVKK